MSEIVYRQTRKDELKAKRRNMGELLFLPWRNSGYASIQLNSRRKVHSFEMAFGDHPTFELLIF